MRNAWANDLATLDGVAVGVEFATPAVSSPGFEAFFPNENPLVLAGALQRLIGPLVYTDTSRRGYLVVTLTPEQAQAEWVYVSSVVNRNFSIEAGPTLRCLPGSAGRRIVAA